mmetsp:Transcript_75481/g.149231  ORF Transcript_75481/g.149231 Transcript_75481/m.149231 type:complete len:398 (+) Transcript_75481:71-1264(+)
MSITKVPTRRKCMLCSAELMVAAQRGQWEKVEGLLQQGADVNAQGALGVSLLMHAARQGAVVAIGTLLAHHADPNIHDSSGNTALAMASRSKACDAATSVRLLLAGAADVAARDCNGRTPLLLVAETGNADVAQALLEGDADLHALARTELPVASAFDLGSKRVAETFIQGRGCNPLEDYIKFRRAKEHMESCKLAQELFEVEDEEELEEEREQGVNHNSEVTMMEEESTPESPVAAAEAGANGTDSGSYFSGSSESFEPEYYGKYFMSRTAPLRPCDLAKPLPTGVTLEAMMENAAALRGVKPRFHGSHASVLVVAARAGHSSVCRLLVENQADASAEDGNGDTALAVAASAGHYAASEALLAGEVPTPQAHGAALSVAEALGREDVVMLLRGYAH